jgi:hypothetical protein
MQDSKNYLINLLKQEKHNKTIYDHINNIIETFDDNNNITEEINNIQQMIELDEKKQMVEEILKYLTNPELKDKINSDNIDESQIKNLDYDDLMHSLLLLTESDFESFNTFLECCL